MLTMSTLASPDEIRQFVDIVRELKRVEGPALNHCSQITVCAVITISAGLDKTSVNKHFERLLDLVIIVKDGLNLKLTMMFS